MFTYISLKIYNLPYGDQEQEVSHATTSISVNNSPDYKHFHTFFSSLCVVSVYFKCLHDEDPYNQMSNLMSRANRKYITYI